jgi:hypothetical protein
MKSGDSLHRRKPRSSQRLVRGGMASLEVVMTIAVMLPVAGALLLLGIKMCATLYQCVGALVAWPFL